MAIIGLHLCDDLIFASRVRAVAAAHGITLTMVRAADELIRIAAASHPACVILDVNALNLRIDGLAPELKAQFPALTLVGYGSHVDAASLRAARNAGCDVVLPRSKFVEVLEAEMPGWFGVTPCA